MNQKLLKDLFIMLGAAVLVFGGSFWLVRNFVVSGDGSADKKISKAEAKLGEFILQNDFVRSLDSLQYPNTYQLYREVSNHLIEALENPKYEYNFLLSSDKTVNAYCAPGGIIVVNIGLIQSIQSPEELAAVLAHEIGHAELSHFRKRLSRALGTTLIASVLTGGDPGVLLNTLNDLVFLGYSRKQENEADDFAFTLLEKSGINPIHLARLLENIQVEEGDMKIPEWISTHPDTENRIEAVLLKTTGKQQDFESITNFVELWETVKEEI
ncbi:MAG: M48 family metallopeptidase [Luteibaculaceae bacterium]